MADAEQVVKELRKAAGGDPRVDLRHLKIKFDPEPGIATLEGEVANVAIKRLALRRAGAVPAVAGSSIGSGSDRPRSSATPRS